MKKIWIALLLALALVLGLAACGGNNAEEPGEPSEEPSQTPTEIVSEEPPEEVKNVDSYTYEYMGLMAKSTLQMDLAEDGTLEFYLVKDPMIKDVFIADYVRDGDTVSISNVENTNANALVSSPTILWPWIVDNSATITVDDATGTFVPVEPEGSDGNSEGGELPNLGDGELPDLGDGKLPDLGDGELPDLGDGKPNLGGELPPLN